MLIDSTGLQVFGAGQWLKEKHGAKSQLHLVVDADAGMIVAQVFTDQYTDDSSQVRPLLDQVDEEIDKMMADGVYDGASTYQTIAQHDDNIEAVIPPRKTAVSASKSGSPSQYDHHHTNIRTESVGVTKSHWLWPTPSGRNHHGSL